MRNDASPDAPAPRPVRLADYQPPAYRIDRAELDFSLDPGRTTIDSRLSIRRSPGTPAGAPLVLHGEKIELLSISLDGATLAKDQYALNEKSLTLFDPPERFTLALRTACAPAANTALSGLYISNDMFCTQCEAEGFRRITYFLDRPDVLAKYAVRIEADRARYPVLLSNGNLVEAGRLPEGRHFVRWEDPHPKPSYLFALVGGDLVAVEDSFITRSGRKVALRIFVQPQNAGKCAYTLDCLKRAMRWDEETFGREYDLDVFMIVAVDHFNFGAMENKGLNIFNSAYVLASPETATDADYEAIESIVAHEYFHNWSGNRVTCRDWFQLCLKEGFTVYRDQEFSADMRSRAVQRIKDVRRLWTQQFPEDAGPLSHPPRPESYITIDNFYTATVYEKGAEIVRMIKTILGPEKFRRACELYFERHDGEAATVEDFVKAMEDGGEVDLKQFRRWYSDAGTPQVSAKENVAANGAYSLELTQRTEPTPGQPDKPPRHIPIAYILYGAQTGRRLAEDVIELKEETARVELGSFAERPIASLLTGFSAPVRLTRNLELSDRLFLAARDEDLFNRWAATESLWRDLCLAAAGAKDMGDWQTALNRFAQALSSALNDSDLDPALAAELLRCPNEADLARNVEIIEPTAIVQGRTHVREVVGTTLKNQLLALYERLRPNRPFEPTAEQAGERALKNAALALLVAAGETLLALEQAKSASNMTDEAAATAALAACRAPERDEALNRFYERWKSDSLVVNKWLAWNALTPEPVGGARGDSSLDHVRRLAKHEAFDRRNPNKVRSLLGVFARENLAGFHRSDGEGYRFFVDEVLAIDSLNPQLAARLAGIFDSWRQLEAVRRGRAEQELRRLAATNGISPNLYEMVARLLA